MSLPTDRDVQENLKLNIHDYRHFDELVSILKRSLRGDIDLGGTPDEMRLFQILFNDPGKVREIREKAQEISRGAYGSYAEVMDIVNRALRLLDQPLNVNVRRGHSNLGALLFNGVEFILNRGERFPRLSSYIKQRGKGNDIKGVRAVARDVQILFTVLRLQLVPDDVWVYRSVGKQYAGFPGTLGHNSSDWSIGDGVGKNSAAMYRETDPKARPQDLIVIKTRFGDLRHDGTILWDQDSMTENAITFVHKDLGRSVSFYKVDLAMLDEGERVGGIDFNPENYSIEGQDAQIKFDFEFDPVSLKGIEVDGLAPFIINISPVTSIGALLGLAENEGADQLGSQHLDPFDRKSAGDAEEPSEDLVPA